MAHWMCTTCGYYIRSSAPPNRCPNCEQVCAFNDVTCYRPECGGEENIDPLAVGNTSRMLKGGGEPAGKRASPSPENISLAQILRRHDLESKEDLDFLSFWAISQIEILKGLSREQRQKIRSLGRSELYESNVVICTEGEEALRFYLVEQGRVSVESEVCRGFRFPISVVYPGQAFGWSALVPPNVYTATVMTLSNTRVIAIERQALLAMMQAEPSVGFIIMQNVASIVASRLRTLENQLAGLLHQNL